MNTLKQLIKSPYFLWLLLSIPAIPMITGSLSGDNLEPLLHPTGEFAARFMIVAMIATPLRMLFPTSSLPLWFAKNRRYFGVAAAGYAALHTLFYVLDLGSLQRILAEITETDIWTGWLAMAIFVPLAITSNDASIKFLKRRWKTLQRFVYPAAILTLVHWLFVANEIGGALVHFIPLAALEIYRIWKVQQKRVAHQVNA
ncbi:sulfite oxidase heme-binding subunit YedZ [Ahrensia kielensis]|uniref:sulfite oxidase heme-binding subunit YedZ n=1 Tax=Ahrensia kielensis TaxID=76980 RepID=UPI00036956FC|nr:ferric reductase-like transmembrane domain-containing protein [Ahrensia kielensis]